MTLLKVKQGDCQSILHNLLVFYYSYMCLEALHLNIFMIQTFCTVMQLFKGSYFSVGAASSHFRPNSAFAQTQTVQRTYFIVMSSVSPASR